MCAHLRNTALHSTAGSRGKSEIKARIFLLHFCLIPLISEGIIGPVMIERPLTRLTPLGATKREKERVKTHPRNLEKH